MSEEEEWDKFFKGAFAVADSGPKMFFYKGILHTPRNDGSYDPPVPEELLKILEKALSK